MKGYNRPLATAEETAKRKNEKYKQIAIDNNAQFVPFIAETSGALGNEAQEFLKTLVRCAHDNQPIYSQRELTKRFTEEIAIAIQRGKARIFFDYYNSYSLISKWATSW